MDHRNPAVEAKLGQWQGMLTTVAVKEDTMGDGRLYHGLDTKDTRSEIESIAARESSEVWTREAGGPEHNRRYRVWVLASQKLAHHLSQDDNILDELDDLLITGGMPWHSQSLYGVGGWIGTLLGFANKRPGVKFHHVPFGVIQDEEHGMAGVLELNRPMLRASRLLLEYIIHDWDNWPSLSETEIKVLRALDLKKAAFEAEVIEKSGAERRAVGRSLKALRYWGLAYKPSKRGGNILLPSGQRFLKELDRAP